MEKNKGGINRKKTKMKKIGFKEWYCNSSIAKRPASFILGIFSNVYLDKTEFFLRNNLNKVQKVANKCGREGIILDFLPATENFIGNTSHRLKVKYGDFIQNEYPEDLDFFIEEGGE